MLFWSFLRNPFILVHRGSVLAGYRSSLSYFRWGGVAEGTDLEVEGVYFGRSTLFCSLAWEDVSPLGNLKFVKNLGSPQRSTIANKIKRSWQRWRQRWPCAVPLGSGHLTMGLAKVFRQLRKLPPLLTWLLFQHLLCAWVCNFSCPQHHARMCPCAGWFI